MEWRLVYQSGHGNTYCNGDAHIDTEGGWCWPDVEHSLYIKSTMVRWTKRGIKLPNCDCDFFGNPKDLNLISSPVEVDMIKDEFAEYDSHCNCK